MSNSEDGPVIASAAESADSVASGPRLTVLLVNQSSSMDSPFGAYGISMSEGIADALNLYLQRIAERRKGAGASEFESGNFGVSIIGYGFEAGAADKIFSMESDSVWADERRTHSDKSTPSSDDTLSSFSTWVDPAAGSADAPLCKALSTASSVIEPWVSKHRLAPPPRVVNITDGGMTDGDPSEPAERLCSLSTLNGATSLWTCHVCGDPEPGTLLFPNNAALLAPELSPLFASTSFLPHDGLSNLLMEFPEVSKISGAKASVFYADLRTLVRFLAFVTRVPMP
jgi:hypothetical protein